MEKIYYEGPKTNFEIDYTDDYKNNFRVIPNNDILKRYKVIKELGRGAYGVVIKVHDYKYNCNNAIKIIRNEPRFNKSSMNELNILSYLNKQYDKEKITSFIILDLYKHFLYKNHHCFVFDEYDINLYQFL